MAFDQATRNRLQKFVGDARKLLSEEFTQQLQNTYGLDPVTGGIAELSALPALSPNEQQTATLLRDTLEHYLAASHKADPHKDKALVIAALDRIVREQAFTVLNRLAALRMAEARQFVMESISQGYQSKGFQLYQRIAGSGLGETGQAYQYYLFSVFDELSLDLAVLFDRYSSQGRLFPRETVLLELLDLINHAELEMLWAEDETVGWIYQYFNSKEERKKMRDESQAPRNSRELAVRNQFFTPRYVVEFLTDNTLGRIWFEMTQGNTALLDSCQYLVRRPNELFLKAGEQAPEQAQQDTAELSQTELLQQTVYIQHRQIKDPRDIKMLDPACGSMHFGLYAFDLFEQIYSEAWDIEAGEGSDIFFGEEGVTRRVALHEAYSSKESFSADVPRLIIEHNIHGVDIDPRAAQIAGLSLWLRAQKSWSDNAIKPNQRPQIQRSNIVCAEPMPGETQLLKEFTSQIQPKVLGQLVEEIFEKMQLAGEAGTLLKIEEEIQVAIDEAKSQKDENILEVQGGLFNDDKWEVREAKRYYNFGDVSDDFWGQAEQLILSQLERYAETASGSGSAQKRLFAADAAKGFAFIDLCRKRFNVVLMNPPFGEPSKLSYKYISKEYKDSKSDLLASFIDRGLEVISDGYIGAITARTAFYLVTLSNWRDDLLNKAQVSVFNDLGFGVMDSAQVEAAAYCFRKGRSSTDGVFFRLLDSQSKEVDTLQEVNNVANLRNSPCSFIRNVDFKSIPGAPFAYWADKGLIKSYASFEAYNESQIDRDSKCGLSTLDNFRFIRLRWEVLATSKWKTYISGGTYSPFLESFPAVVNWDENGYELKVFVESRVGSASRKVQGEGYYFKPGFTFPRRTRSFCPKIMPKNSIYSTAGQAGFANEVDLPWIIPMMSSLVVSYLISLSQGSRTGPQFEVGLVKGVPWPEPSVKQKTQLEILFLSICQLKAKVLQMDETSEWFWGVTEELEKKSLSEIVSYRNDVLFSVRREIRNLKNTLNELVCEIYSLPLNEWKNIADELCDELCEEEFSDYFGDGVIDAEEFNASDIAFLLLNNSFSRVFENSGLKTIQADCSLELEVHNCFENRADMAFEKQVVFSKSSNTSQVSSLEAIERVIGSNIGPKLVEDILDEFNISSIGEYLVKPTAFFDKHLKQYSSHKRQAPIYWPLQTASASFTIWIHYHRIDKSTLFSCVNDSLDPKIKLVESDIKFCSDKAIHSSNDEDQIQKLSDLYEELKNMREEILRVAEFWYPDMNDGVLITAAPLWRLFKHKSWQKKLKSTLHELQSGQYEWSTMAFNLFPERVLRKCHVDRSIAIAHNVEADLWEEVDVPVARGSGTKLVWQPREMTESELNTYIQQEITQE